MSQQPESAPVARVNAAARLEWLCDHETAVKLIGAKLYAERAPSPSSDERYQGKGAELFEASWAKFIEAGYRYGPDALEQVKFGWEIAHGRTPDATTEPRSHEKEPQSEPRSGLPAGWVAVSDEQILKVAAETIPYAVRYSGDFEADDAIRFARAVLLAAAPSA